MLGSRGKGKVVPRKPQPHALSAIEEASSSVFKALGQELDGNSSSIHAATSLTSGSTAAAATTAQSQQFSSCSALSRRAAAAAKPEASPGSSSSSSSSSNALLVTVHPDIGPGRSAAVVGSTHSSSSSSSTQPQWRCAPYLAGGQVPELPQQLLGTAIGRQILSQGHPAVMRNLHLATCKLQDAAAAQGSRTAAQLMQPAVAHGQSNKQQQQGMLSVLCSPSDANRFLVADMNKNAPGSYYHLRKPETSVLSMSFADWLAAWQTWEKSRLLLQADVCIWELSPQSGHGNATRTAGAIARLWPNTALWPNLPQLLSTEQTSRDFSSPSTADEVPAANPPPSTASLIHWGALQQLLTDGKYQQKGQLQLVAGGRDALLPAQYHTHDRLLCQVSGRQQLLLIPPSQCFKGCYPYPVAHPYDRYSCVDWEEPELEHWPAAAQLTGLQCQLNPGDCILLPAYWFVHSQLQQPACVSLVLQLHPLAIKLQEPSALLMQVSRMAEIWMAAEIGAAKVRHWFVALSEGREWQQLQKQLVTVKGYKLLRVCHMIMQQMQQVLSLKPASLSSGSTSSVPAAGAAASSSTAGREHCHRSTGPNIQAGGAQCSHAVACGSALECEARTMMGLMCAGRLMSTHWLNQGITDPLYLKHQPEYYLLEEDAEAAKYPGLFQHRLIGNNPNWQQHAQPLQLALPGSGRTLMPRTDKALTA